MNPLLQEYGSSRRAHSRQSKLDLSVSRSLFGTLAWAWLFAAGLLVGSQASLAWAAQSRGSLPPECGNNVIEAFEACDGTSDALCPGECLPLGDPNECQCPVCGDAVINQAGEDCDGPDLGVCTAGCNPPGDPQECQCAAAAVCGDNSVQAGEDCDGTDDAACPGACFAPASLFPCSCPFCGDGIVTPPGEICEPGAAEVCNNFVDDDGDALIDCDDTADCPQGGTTCGADCLDVVACQPPTSDPAYIRFSNNNVSLDAFRMHAQFIPQTLVDLPIDGFAIQITNAAGIVYSAEVLGSDFMTKGRGRRFRFRGRVTDRRNTSAIYYLVVKKKAVNYAFRLKAYADFSAADDPRMTTHVVIGNDGASITTDWTPVRNGWRLRASDFNQGG